MRGKSSTNHGVEWATPPLIPPGNLCHSYPIGSMYSIYGNIYHQYTPVILAYIPAPWILWVWTSTIKNIAKSSFYAMAIASTLQSSMISFHQKNAPWKQRLDDVSDDLPLRKAFVIYALPIYIYISYISYIYISYIYTHHIYIYIYIYIYHIYIYDIYIYISLYI